MAQVTVTIAGKTYRMACDDGQEEHLLGLASRLDQTIDQLRGVFGEIGDQRLTVMSAITVLDRMVETERRLDALTADLAEARAETDRMAEAHALLESRLAEALLTTATRIETLAEALAGGKREG